MKNFFVLKPEGGIRFGTKWAYGELLEPICYSESQFCPICGSPVSGKKWIAPHTIKLSSSNPSKWGDFVWGSGFGLIISHRFFEIYNIEKLSGFSAISEPIKIAKFGNRVEKDISIEPPSYHYAVIPWGGAEMNLVASEMKYAFPDKTICDYCHQGGSGKHFEQLIIIENSWNGSDVFIPRGVTGTYVVSERFKKVVEQYRMKNIWLIPCEKYAYDEPSLRLGYVKDK